MANLIGQRLGQYQITGLLGRGGMAMVYRAQQASIGREVAVKVIRADHSDDANFLQRFEREARTVASLSHPHIIKVFDYGQENEMVYLVMELLQGGSLANLVKQGPLSVERAYRIIDQIASALDYAHGLGIVHRDLKPQNVLLDTQGNANLTDFGIAKLLSETNSLTQSGGINGTPSYMAPEQWQGLALDGRVDIYALGVMLFEVLTGRLPFLADTPYMLMSAHIYQPVPRIRDLQSSLPPAIDAVLDKVMAKDREARYATGAELVADLREALARQSPQTVPRRPKMASIPTVISGGVTAPITMPLASRDLQPVPPAAQQSRPRWPFIVVGLAVAAFVVGLGGTLLVATVANKSTPTPARARPQSSRPQSSRPQSSRP